MVKNQEHLIPKGEPKDWKMAHLEDLRDPLMCFIKFIL